jgi:N-acetylmuramoyl-L-alanine amidase
MHRRFRPTLTLFVFLLPVLAAALPQAPPPPPPDRPTGLRSPTVVLDGRELPVPVSVGPGGPMVELQALARELGGELTAGELGAGYTLKIDDVEVVLGLGSAIVTVGDKIVSLTQPPAEGPNGPRVPVDFLRKTWGELLGYTFDWRPETARLAISRRSARELSVSVDVVHLQGVTTVVLQFPEPPRYRIEQVPGGLAIQMQSDRLRAPASPLQVDDPLVQGVTVDPRQIRISLLPGSEVESYVLEDPFRVVFDIHQSTEVEVPTSPTRRRREEDLPGIRTIVIDPGHGGTETGAIGPSGVVEKDLTLQLAAELEQELERRLGVRVVLTRNEDANLPHETRTAIANQNKADLFISLHLNSALGSGAHGAETYFLSLQATDSRAEAAAAAENPARMGAAAPADAEDPDLRDLQLILWDLAQTHHLGESQRFATMVQRELNETLQLRDRGVKQAPFLVLMGAAMPAVLVELGFLSNPDEEAKLQDPGYRSRLVDSLTRAVARYKSFVENRALPAAPAAPAGQPGNPGNPP